MTGKIVTIAQQKGGAGKTTLSVHLAVAWSRLKGKSVGVLDVDPQGSLGEWFEAREEALGEDATGLEFRTASGWGARREAQRLAREHDYVVVDTPPHADLEARATETTLELLGDAAPGIIVLNRVPPRGRLAGEMIEAMKEFGGDIAKNQLGNRVAYAECIAWGLSVQERSGNAKAVEEVEALSAELRRRLG